MSINAMTNAAVARRPDFQPAGSPPQGLAGVAQAAASPPAAIAPGAPEAAPSTPPSSGTTTALQTLTTYIPTEVLTLYVSAVAALGTLPGDEGRRLGRWAPFIVFLVFTPALVWVAYATKVKGAGKPLPMAPSRWPLWEMIAATLAFAAWTFALPSTPFEQFTSWYSPGLAGFLVLIISAGLGIIAPLMQRPLPN